MKQLAVLAMAFLLVHCTGHDQPGPGEHIYWVNSLKVACTGVSPTHCLQVQKAELPDPTAWELFYAPISGFEYEEGYQYKLIVREEELDPAQVPADGSSVAYTLVKVIEKNKDKRLVLNDIWVLNRLRGQAVDAGSLSEEGKSPRLEIHVGEMQYKGSDGCNNIFGGLIELSETHLKFGIGAGTRMMCQEMDIPDEFNRTLPEVTGYKVAGTDLLLFNEEGEELMRFGKAD